MQTSSAREDPRFGEAITSDNPTKKQAGRGGIAYGELRYGRKEWDVSRAKWGGCGGVGRRGQGKGTRERHKAQGTRQKAEGVKGKAQGRRQKAEGDKGKA